jgi:hypothetical protein
MTAPIGIVNLALGFLGQSPIVDMDTPTTPLAVTCQRLFPSALDTVLSLYAWSFATGYVRLTLLADPPPGPWTKMYNFPPNLPKALMVWSLDQGEDEWELGFDPVGNQTVIYTHAPGLISTGDTAPRLVARCTFRRENTGEWNEIAVQALAYKLAADLALTVTGQGAKWQAMTQSMQFWLNEATKKDSKQSARTVPLSSGLVRVRD